VRDLIITCKGTEEGTGWHDSSNIVNPLLFQHGRGLEAVPEAFRGGFYRYAVPDANVGSEGPGTDPQLILINLSRDRQGHYDHVFCQ
jgi:hypothetical protein